jgi:hypothetical protein
MPDSTSLGEPLSWMTLWLPILLSSIAVFIVSSLIHTVLKYHKNDFRRVANEDAIIDAVRAQNLAPGEYAAPYAPDAGGLKDPAFLAKWERGPVFLTVLPRGSLGMGSQLAQWFVYILLTSVSAAYIASHALDRGAHYMDVFRFAGATAFFCYAFAHAQQSIWYKRPWGTTAKNFFDGLVYALITAGFFGWLWPL